MPLAAVVVVPGPPVSSLFGLSILFNQRTDHLLCGVDQNAEGRLHDEIYETWQKKTTQRWSIRMRRPREDVGGIHSFLSRQCVQFFKPPAGVTVGPMLKTKQCG